MPKTQFEFREVWVLREVRIDPKKLKRGDVFRFEKATADDAAVDPNEYYICKARPKPTEPKGNLLMNMAVLIHPKLGKTLNLTWLPGRNK